jgi:hypothetical protein
MRSWFLTKRAEIEARERKRRPSPAESLAMAELGWTSKAIIFETLQDAKVKAMLPGAIERGLQPLRRALKGRP